MPSKKCILRGDLKLDGEEKSGRFQRFEAAAAKAVKPFFDHFFHIRIKLRFYG